MQDKHLVSNNVAVPSDFDRSAIGFNACTFSWDPFDAVANRLARSTAREQFFLRFDSEVTFKRGCINIIVGPTGSGKVSLIHQLYAR